MEKHFQLIVKNLAAERADNRIFENVSFKLSSGEGMTVTGPNGVGKSTLLRVLAGLIRPANGFVHFEGGIIGSNIHYLGAHNAMKANLTVGENLRFWQAFYGDGGPLIDDVLEKVHLPDIADVPFSDLSTGQKRRVSIARLFVVRRPLWLLDEPTSGLDTASEHMFTGFITDHLHEGGIVVAATHLTLGVDMMKNLRFAGSL